MQLNKAYTSIKGGHGIPRPHTLLNFDKGPPYHNLQVPTLISIIGECKRHNKSIIMTLVITKSDKSMRFMRRSEMVLLTYWTAPGMSLSTNILWRHSVTRFLTNKQLSLRTVSMPVHENHQIRAEPNKSLVA